MNTRDGLSWPVIWTAIYVANLILPLLLGWGVTSDGGRIGMICAIAALWAFGLLVSA